MSVKTNSAYASSHTNDGGKRSLRPQMTTKSGSPSAGSYNDPATDASLTGPSPIARNASTRRCRPSPVRQEEGHALGAPRVDGSDPMEAAEFCPLRRVCLEAADRRRSAGRSGDVKAHRAAILPGASGAEKVVRGAAGQQRRWRRRGDRGEQEEAIPSPCHRIPITAAGEAARASIISRLTGIGALPSFTRKQAMAADFATAVYGLRPTTVPTVPTVPWYRIH